MTDVPDDETTRIVALLENPDAVDACLDCATEAAACVPSRLRALHVGSDPCKAGLSPEELDMRILHDIEKGSSPEQRRADIAAGFAGWQAAHPGAAALTLEDDEGDVARITGSGLDLAGLVVMASPKTLDGRDALHGVLFDARRLVLVVPVAPPPRPSGLLDHVVIGWKPGASVERMVETALPWLRQAGRITVLGIRHPEREGDAERGESFFRRLGLEVAHAVAERGEGSVGRSLMQEATRRGASCLAIGAFHHGEVWESVLGGVTRDVLEQTLIPTFMMR